jgi:hypothetical protein
LRRPAIKAKKFQSEVKFRHALFGESRGRIFLLAYGFYFFDTLLYQSLIGLTVMLALLIFTYMFAFGQSSVMSKSLLYLLIAFSLISVSLSFVLRVPTLFDDSERKPWVQRTLEVLGLEIPPDAS